MNTNIYDREKYTKSETILKTDEDFYHCLQILTSNPGLCQGIYSDEDIRRFMDMSKYVIIRRDKTTMKVIASKRVRIPAPEDSEEWANMSLF